jgi:hypothetical protein
MTGESDEEIVSTRVALNARKALRKKPALQISPHFLLDVPGQAALVILARVREERCEVFADELIENGLGRTTRSVGGREGGHEGARFARVVPERIREISRTCSTAWASRTERMVATDRVGEVTVEGLPVSIRAICIGKNGRPERLTYPARASVAAMERRLRPLRASFLARVIARCSWSTMTK